MIAKNDDRRHAGANDLAHPVQGDVYPSADVSGDHADVCLRKSLRFPEVERITLSQMEIADCPDAHAMSPLRTVFD